MTDGGDANREVLSTWDDFANETGFRPDQPRDAVRNAVKAKMIIAGTERKTRDAVLVILRQLARRRRRAD